MTDHDVPPPDEAQTSTAIAARTPTDDWLANQTGVELVESGDGRRHYSLPPELSQKCVLLVPASQVVQLTTSYTPVPRVVQIDTREARDGGDVYKVGRTKNSKGNWDDQMTLTSRALAQIAERAGIEHHETRRVHYPQGMETIVTARHRGADGVWIYTTRSKVTNFEQRAERVRLDAIEKAKKDENPEPSEADLHKLVVHDREFLAEKDETKAFSRCIRAILGASSYAKGDLEQRQGRFLTVSYAFTPDLTQPGIKQLIDANYRTAVGELFDGEGPAQIEAPRVEVEGAKPASEFVERELPADEAEAGEGDEDAPEVDGELASFPEDPEEFDGDADPGSVDGSVAGEEPVLWEDDTPPKPAEAIVFGKGPYEGKSAEELVQDAEGLKYVAVQARKQRAKAKRELALAWLSWGAGKVLTFEDLDKIAPPDDAPPS